tara:strand:- start:3932 stop:4822 length:891 start_codon:yes stop_codon:yes gene_type:complete
MNNKKFFTLILSTYFLAILSVLIFLIPVLFNFYNSAEEKLIKYQLKKIKNNNYNTIFLGDSSLGNLIDANEWAKLSKNSTGNLALFGITSFYGAYRMLTKEEFKELKNIYILSSIDIWNRPKSSVDPYFIISENKIKKILSVLNSRDFRNISKLYLNFLNEKMGLGIEAFKIKTKLQNDYIIQNLSYKLPQNIPHEFKFKLIDDKVFYLKKIFNICDERNLNCIFINGIIYEKFCEHEGYSQFLINLKNLLAKNRINYLDNRTCLPYEMLGDAYDHLHPQHKVEFTNKFYRLVKKN